MLRYKANVTVNVRSSTSTAVANIIGSIPAGTEFIGSAHVTGNDGVKYVDLVSAGGINRDGYVSTKANITLIEDTGETTPPSEPVQNFPESFILTDPKNPAFKAEYVFVRIVE